MISYEFIVNLVILLAAILKIGHFVPTDHVLKRLILTEEMSLNKMILLIEVLEGGGVHGNPPPLGFMDYRLI